MINSSAFHKQAVNAFIYLQVHWSDIPIRIHTSSFLRLSQNRSSCQPILSVYPLFGNSPGSLDGFGGAGNIWDGRGNSNGFSDGLGDGRSPSAGLKDDWSFCIGFSGGKWSLEGGGGIWDGCGSLRDSLDTLWGGGNTRDDCKSSRSCFNGFRCGRSCPVGFRGVTISLGGSSTLEELEMTQAP